MMCQSGLTVFMPSFDNALRPSPVTTTGQDGGPVPQARGSHGPCAVTRRQPGRNANSQLRHASRVRPVRDSSAPSRDARHRGSRLRTAPNVDKKTAKFSRKLLSSRFEPCSICPLSRAKVFLRMAPNPTGHGQSVQMPAPWPGNVFLSCGRPVTPVAIRGCLSSSSLPPSFARGRRTTVFFPRRSASPASAFAARTGS